MAIELVYLPHVEGMQQQRPHPSLQICSRTPRVRRSVFDQALSISTLHLRLFARSRKASCSQDDDICQVCLAQAPPRAPCYVLGLLQALQLLGLIQKAPLVHLFEECQVLIRRSRHTQRCRLARFTGMYTFVQLDSQFSGGDAIICSNRPKMLH